MRRIRIISITMILLVALSSICMADPVTTTDFKIKGYKQTSESSSTPFLNMYVTDAVHSTLDDIKSGSSLDITDSVSDLLGTISTTELDPYATNSVFSYRVTGNATGKYTVTVTFGPQFWPVTYADGVYTYLTGDTINLDTDHMDISYALPYTSYTFNDEKSHPGTSFTEDYVTYTLTQGSGTNKGYTNSSGSASNDLVENWTFTAENQYWYGTTPDVCSVDYWVAKGIIAMTISKEDYEAATYYGTYATTAKITLTYDEA